jgi:hypothetical protein
LYILLKSFQIIKSFSIFREALIIIKVYWGTNGCRKCWEDMGDFAAIEAGRCFGAEGFGEDEEGVGEMWHLLFISK